jgi:hypothetical protein
LREEAERDEDNKTVSVAWCPEKIKPRIGFEFFLESESFANLPVFDLHELVFGISTCVAFCEDIESFFVLAFGNEISRGFRNEPIPSQLDVRVNRRLKSRTR